MKARDLMVPVHDFLNPEDTLKHAVNLLRTARRGEEKIGAKGLPVLDERGSLVGMLSMRDILKAVFPSYMSLLNLGEFSWDGMVEEIAGKSKDRKVKEVMSPAVVSVDDDAPLMECVDHMIKHNIKRLPVINSDNRVVGMIYERDLFFSVTKAMLEKESS